MVGECDLTFLVFLEQGEVDDPEEGQLFVALWSSQVETQASQNLDRGPPSVCGYQEHVPGARFHPLDQALGLGVAQELGDR